MTGVEGRTARLVEWRRKAGERSAMDRVDHPRACAEQSLEVRPGSPLVRGTVCTVLYVLYSTYRTVLIPELDAQRFTFDCRGTSTCGPLLLLTDLKSAPMSAQVTSDRRHDSVGIDVDPLPVSSYSLPVTRTLVGVGRCAGVHTGFVLPTALLFLLVLPSAVVATPALGVLISVSGCSSGWYGEGHRDSAPAREGLLWCPRRSWGWGRGAVMALAGA